MSNGPAVPQFQTLPDEADDWESASTASPAFTGYLSDPLSLDVDWFRLNVGPGTYQISVLPDLVEIFYPPGTLPGAEGQPVLWQETLGLQAFVYQRVHSWSLSSGEEDWLVALGATGDSIDSLAMQGRLTLADITFATDQFTLPAARFEQYFIDGELVATENFLAEYYIEIIGAAVPMLNDPVTDGPLYTEDAGRYLVTIGNPTGQRAAKWGNDWIDQYVWQDNLLPDEAGFTAQSAPGGSSGQRAELVTPPFHYDSGSGHWSVPSLSLDLSALGTGANALIEVLKEEASGAAMDWYWERFQEFAEETEIPEAAEAVEQLSGQTQTAVDVFDALNSFTDGIFGVLHGVASGQQTDPEVIDAQVRDLARTLQQDMLNAIDTGSAQVDDFIRQLAGSLFLVERHSDPQFAMVFDVGEGVAPLMLSDGHADAVIGRDLDDRIETGDLDDAVFAADGNDAVFGGSGNDLLSGGYGLDYLSGGTGDDHLHAVDDRDWLVAGAGNDLLYGGNGSDFADGGADRDVIYGGSAADALVGEAGNDTLYGGDGAAVADDWLTGDGLFGGAGGNDLLYGGAGGDVIVAGGGDDTAYGGADNDRIQGGAGNDVLVGDGGDDLLAGGAGNDRFVASGNEAIVDWNAGDVVDLRGLGIEGFETLVITPFAGGVLVSHDGAGLALTVLLDPGDSLGSGAFLIS